MPDTPLFTINKSVTKEQALNYASDLMRCLITLTHESCDSDPQTSRALNFSALHLATMTKAFVDHSAERV